MRKFIIRAAAVAASISLVTIGASAQAAKPSSNTNQVWTTLATSTADGSKWVMIQGEKIQQPGNSIWNIVWQKGDGPCLYYYGINGSAPYTYTGEWGVQTGATWGPTDFVFAWVGTERQGYLAKLSLGEAYPYTLGTQWAQPLIDAGCTHGILYSLTSNKDAKVLDDFVPLDLS